MKEYILSPEALVMTSGSSIGTQKKYYDNGYWYKQNNLGYEGLAEYFATRVLQCSNVKVFVEYEPCVVNGRPGCRSKNFLTEDETFISFQRLHEMYEGTELNDKIRVIPDTESRIEYVLDFIKEKVNLDCREYLSNILSLDMLLLNTDRHFHNLGIIANRKENIYRPAPIFDNGNSLLSDFERFDKEPLIENIDKVIGQPFSANLENQASVCGINLKINYRKLGELLKNEQESRGLSVLKYQLKRYEQELSMEKEFEIAKDSNPIKRPNPNERGFEPER